MHATDQADLARILLENDASFGFYRNYHWARVVREVVAPWIDARAPRTGRPPLTVTAEVLELVAKSIVASDHGPADGSPISDEDFLAAWEDENIQKLALRRAAAAILPYVIYALRAADETAAATDTDVDLGEVRDLLAPLAGLYPDTGGWLERRVGEIHAGAAVAETVRISGRLVGVVIGVRKSETRFKISTLFVAAEYRGRGLGRLLLRSILNTAAATATGDLGEVYLTAAHDAADELKPLLRSEGFSLIATEEHRYGDGRHEMVFARPIGSQLEVDIRA